MNKSGKLICLPDLFLTSFQLHQAGLLCRTHEPQAHLETDDKMHPGLVDECFSLIPGPLRGPFGWIGGVFFWLCQKNTPPIHLCERRRRVEWGEFTNPEDASVV